MLSFCRRRWLFLIIGIIIIIIMEGKVNQRKLRYYHRFIRDTDWWGNRFIEQPEGLEEREWEREREREARGEGRAKCKKAWCLRKERERENWRKFNLISWICLIFFAPFPLFFSLFPYHLYHYQHGLTSRPSPV